MTKEEIVDRIQKIIDEQEHWTAPEGRWDKAKIRLDDLISDIEDQRNKVKTGLESLVADIEAEEAEQAEGSEQDEDDIDDDDIDDID